MTWRRGLRSTASPRTGSPSRSADRLSGAHPIAEAAARSLPQGSSPGARAYAALLQRRFAALEEAARGDSVSAQALGLGTRERAVARRVLRTLEARWHDGDENLVRGTLDAWTAPAQGTGSARAASATAGRLLQAGAELLRIAARAEAWWFFLWELESLIGLVSDEGRC